MWGDWELSGAPGIPISRRDERRWGRFEEPLMMKLQGMWRIGLLSGMLAGGGGGGSSSFFSLTNKDEMLCSLVKTGLKQ